MVKWKQAGQLALGWGLMLAGVLVMLDANLPASSWPRSRMWLATQAVAGFALMVTGWWLRRGAVCPPGKPQRRPGQWQI